MADLFNFDRFQRALQRGLADAFGGNKSQKPLAEVLAEKIIAELRAAGIGPYPLFESVLVDASPYTADSALSVILVDTTAEAITINLPPAADMVKRTLVIKKIAGPLPQAVIVVPDGSETIDDQASISIPAAYTARTLFSDGTAWWVI